MQRTEWWLTSLAEEDTLHVVKCWTPITWYRPHKVIYLCLNIYNLFFFSIYHKLFLFWYWPSSYSVWQYDLDCLYLFLTVILFFLYFNTEDCSLWCFLKICFLSEWIFDCRVYSVMHHPHTWGACFWASGLHCMPGLWWNK